MKFRNMAGASVFWCVLVGSLLLLAGPGCQGVSAEDESTVVAEFTELSAYGSFSPEELCQSLCGECSCRGTLVSENMCQCSCDFSPDSAGEQNCTTQVRRLCEQMDVQCDFNGPEEDYVREPRGCHSMSCYEKHHDHEAGEYGGYHDGEGYGYDEEGHGHGHGGKQLICCKDKKHKEKKHKHKKHKKLHDKHMKFHVVIKGKIPETSCHGEGHGGEGHYGGYHEDDGYRAAKPDKVPMNPAHAPMDVTVWTNRQKLAKKHPFRRPFQQHHQHHQPPPPHYAPAYPSPPYPAEPRGKSAEPPSSGPRPESMPEPMHPSQDTRPPAPPQAPPPPPAPPTEPESPAVTPFPERPLTPPPNLYDGAPVRPKKPPQEPPKPHKFSPPSPPPPPPPPPPPSHYSRPAPPMITVDPPPRRIESSRSFAKPSSYPSCQFDSYDVNFYHPPPSYHAPPPPPPPPPAPPSSYRSYSSSSYDPSYPSSHYHPVAQYENSKHYSAYDEPVEYSTYDDSREYYPDRHGVHPFSDNEIEDWPEFPPRSPSDIFIYNQIVSRQIIEADTARRYMTRPFQPTPRPLRDEFEPPAEEVGPVLYESFGPAEKNYDMYPAPTPPPDAFIPPVPPPAIPVEFPEAEHEPAMFAQNSEEALYPQPTPPPHYLLAKETGSMSSFGFEEHQPEFSPHWESSGYSRSAGGPSHYRAASSRSSSQHSRRYY